MCVRNLNRFNEVFENSPLKPPNIIKFQSRAESLLNNDEPQYGRFPESMANDIKSVWNDPSIQEIYAKRSTMNLNDSAK